MQFTSTRNSKLSVKFSQAVKSCIPEDGGVYVPSPDAIYDLRRWIYYINENTSFSSIAGTLTPAFMQDEISPILCENIATRAFPFKPNVKQLDKNLFQMELFNGYTGCYRDFGVSYLCSYLEITQELYGGSTLFLDYTNGEIGSLLSKVLHGKKHIKAVLLYKKGTVRGIAQEDLIYNGGNILPVEIDASESQIKEILRQIFADKDFIKENNISVANTTNVCRLMSQVFYYPYSFAQIKNKIDGEIYYASDAGNYSTLMSGLYSWRFALPVNGFYMPSTSALSCDFRGNPKVLDSFVDISKRDESNPVDPANLERLENFFSLNGIMMRNFVFPVEVDEKSREKAAKELYMKYGIFADRGTASAYASVKNDAEEIYDENGAVVLISQNHPSLDAEYCRHVLGQVPAMPKNVKESLIPVELNKACLNSAEEIKDLIKNSF